MSSARRRQELWASWFVAVPLLTLGFGTWAAFLFVGLRTGKRTWLVWAAAYALLAITLGLATAHFHNAGRPKTAGFLEVMAMLLGTVHLAAIRTSYLRALSRRRAEETGSPIRVT